MKQLNFTINDKAHMKLEEIQAANNIANKAETIEFLINRVYKMMKEKQMKAKTTEIGVKGRFIHE